MSSPRPNLFLIGAMKSGTTYLSQLLAAHPAIFMSSPKEPTRFVDPRVLRREWPYMWRQGYCTNEQSYLELFAGAGSAPIIAEASTAYSKAPTYSGVAQRILKFNAQARFLYVMRDPVERTISHYWFRVRTWREHRSMLSAIRRRPLYTSVSHYQRQLAEYLLHVERSRIYVLTFEQLLAQPVETMNGIYDWLGIDRVTRIPQLPASNVRPDTLEQVRGFGMLDRLRQTRFYRRAAPYLPRTARELADRLAVRALRPAETNDLDTRAFLRLLQVPQTQELSRLLGRSFPEWKTLHGTADATLVPADYGVRRRSAG
jgi:hypothetical protein